MGILSNGGKKSKPRLVTSTTFPFPANSQQGVCAVIHKNAAEIHTTWEWSITGESQIVGTICSYAIPYVNKVFFHFFFFSKSHESLKLEKENVADK